jgi:valyl-tRNA synthetase
MQPTYRPQDIEPVIYAGWVRARAFVPRPSERVFSIVIPPPNVTGALHIGHALNNTIQDACIRFQRKAGAEALWVPGADHAGIATQTVVERRLAESGSSHHSIGRAAFLERVGNWKEECLERIRKQLRAMGALPDWERERFTLDEVCSRAVIIAFIKLHSDGLIYRGRRMVHWCPRCVTALSDLEVEHSDIKGKLYTVAYPLEDGSGVITVATTRPETMLGDVAIAVHPEDPRFAGLVGRTARLAISTLPRSLPIIADSSVDREFGTGALKITPGHDPLDLEIGTRHRLPVLDILTDVGLIADTVDGESLAPFTGLDRARARAAVLKDLSTHHLLVATTDYTHAVGHCQRCHTPVEPRISSQWFVRMRPLADRALLALRSEGAPAFIPVSWASVYERWLENILDWCISRQLWWGHRLPVWYCLPCNRDARALVHPPHAPESRWVDFGELTQNDLENVQKIHIPATADPTFVVSESPPDACPRCGGDRFLQEVDVLDTWFSSSLWPFSVFGWPEATQDLMRYYPTTVLITAFDIIFFWVARMVMMGLHFTGQVPFREVYIHGLIRDIQGRKMSKSSGNTVDPMEVIGEVGADALRFSFAYALSKGQDVRLSQDKLEGARRFLNKIWNASRLIYLSNKVVAPPVSLPLQTPGEPSDWADRWILSELSAVVPEVLRHYRDYDFREAAHLLHRFAWSEFCDWYLEIVKDRLNSEQKETREQAVRIALFVLQTLYHLLHPICPFQTEALYGQFHRNAGGLLTEEPFPRFSFSDDEAVGTAGAFKDLVARIRELKADLGIAPSRPVPIYASGIPADWRPLVRRMALLSDIYAYDEIAVPAGLVERVGPWTICVLVDDPGAVRTCRKALETDLADRTSELARIEARLGNDEFIRRAPPEEVQKFQNLRDDLRREIAALGERIQRLASLA